jgi:hypothetical protein
VTFVVDGKRVSVGASADGRFEVPAAAGQTVEIPAGAARDRYGNLNGHRLAFVG